MRVEAERGIRELGAVESVKREDQQSPGATGAAAESERERADRQRNHNIEARNRNSGERERTGEQRRGAGQAGRAHFTGREISRSKTTASETERGIFGRKTRNRRGNRVETGGSRVPRESAEKERKADSEGLPETLSRRLRLTY